MKSFHALAILLFLVLGKITAQETILSPSGLIEYQSGTLPIVIAVPHGGTIAPDSIPNRNCNNPVLKNELMTIEVARAISDQLENLTGCYPHLVINHLHRSKVDCNLNAVLGTCFEPIAEQVWSEYHQLLNSALQDAGMKNRGNTFLIDLQAHEHEIQRVELGYLISGVTMQTLNATLDIDDPIHLTSIENLIDDNSGELSRSQLLRGQLSFGSLLESNHFPSVPSASRPYPINSSEYQSGGYTTQTYAHPDRMDAVIAILMKLNFVGLRDSPAHINTFGLAFAQSINTYIHLHREQEIIHCNEAPDFQPPPDALLQEDLILYPNPALQSIEYLTIAGKAVLQKKYAIHDVAGRLVGAGIVENYQVKLNGGLASGMYVFTLKNKEGDILHTRKFVLVE